MIRVILDHWSWSRPLQRNASLKLRPRQRINVCPISKQCTSTKRFSCYRIKFIHSWRFCYQPISRSGTPYMMFSFFLYFPSHHHGQTCFNIYHTIFTEQMKEKIWVHSKSKGNEKIPKADADDPILCFKADLGSKNLDLHNSYKFQSYESAAVWQNQAEEKNVQWMCMEFTQMRNAATKVWNQIYIWFALVRCDFWFICSKSLRANLSENLRTRIQENVVIIHCVIA